MYHFLLVIHSNSVCILTVSEMWPHSQCTCRRDCRWLSEVIQFWYDSWNYVFWFAC